MKNIIEWMKNHKVPTIVLLVIVIAIIAVLIAAVSGAFAPQGKSTSRKKQIVNVTLNVTADNGWNENSTPAIAHITGDNDVDFYHAVPPDAEGNKGSSTVALEEGDYTVGFISPVTSEDAAFNIYDTGSPINVTVDAGAKTPPVVDCSMTQMPAGQVTDEMFQEMIDQIKNAIKNGDKTLKDDADFHILDKLEDYVASNPNATEERTQEATNDDKKVDANKAPAQTTPSDTTDNSSSQSQTDGQPDNTDSSASSSSSNDSSISSSSSPSSQTSQPTHTHTWVNHEATRQVWVSNWVDVPDYSTQKVVVGTTFIFAYDGYSTTDIDEAKAHAVELIKQNLPDNYHTEAIYETQTVQTGSHKEDHGSYKTETYVDYVYCSSCGARK